jgi:hypothetical protein
MTFTSQDSPWTTKGATLSHKSAEKEFSLTFDEIVEGIRAGKLQYRENSIYGAPFLRLIRSEVEALVSEKYGKDRHCSKSIEGIMVWLLRYGDVPRYLSAGASGHPETNPTPVVQQYEHRFGCDRQSFAFFDSAGYRVQLH